MYNMYMHVFESSNMHTQKHNICILLISNNNMIVHVHVQYHNTFFFLLCVKYLLIIAATLQLLSYNSIEYKL